MKNVSFYDLYNNKQQVVGYIKYDPQAQKPWVAIGPNCRVGVSDDQKDAERMVLEYYDTVFSNKIS